MAQFALPTSDLDNTGVWGTTPLWSKIEEGVASADGTVITADGTPTSAEPFTVDLGTVTDPAVATGHIIRAHWAKDSTGGADYDLVIELREGYVSEASQGTLRATATFGPEAGATLQTDSYTLSAAEANSISDYSDLQFRIYAQKNGGGANRNVQIDAVELEVPDAATTYQKTVSLGAAIQDTFTKTVSLSAAIKDTLTKTVSLDAAIVEVFTKTLSLDGAILATLTKAVSLDGAVQQLGLTKSVSFDASITVASVDSPARTVDRKPSRWNFTPALARDRWQGLFKGMRHALLHVAGGGFVDAITGEVLPKNGSVNEVVSPVGDGLTLPSGANANYVGPFTPKTEQTAPQTWLVVFKRTGSIAASDWNHFMSYTDGSGTGRVPIYLSDEGASATLESFFGGVETSGSLVTPLNEVAVGVVTYNGSNRVRLYLNGTLDVEGVDGGRVAEANVGPVMRVLNHKSGDFGCDQSEVYAIYAWDRVLTDNEIREVSLYPFDPFYLDLSKLEGPGLLGVTEFSYDQFPAVIADRKPSFGFDPALVADEWKWFWDEESVIVPLLTGSEVPYWYLNGRPYAPVTVRDGPDGIVKQGPSGPEAHMGNRAYGVNQTYGIEDADLPDWFPGNATGEPFTAIAYCRPEGAVTGDSLNTLHKGTGSTPPYFLWFEPTEASGGVAWNINGVNLYTNVGASEKRLGWHGVMWDGSVGTTIQDDKITDTTWNIGSISTNAGPFNIGTRTPTYSGDTRSFQGDLSMVIVRRTALTQQQLDQLARDPGGMFRLDLSKLRAIPVEAAAAAAATTGGVFGPPASNRFRKPSSWAVTRALVRDQELWGRFVGPLSIIAPMFDYAAPVNVVTGEVGALATTSPPTGIITPHGPGLNFPYVGTAGSGTMYWDRPGQTLPITLMSLFATDSITKNQILATTNVNGGTNVGLNLYLDSSGQPVMGIGGGTQVTLASARAIGEWNLAIGSYDGVALRIGVLNLETMLWEFNGVVESGSVGAGTDWGFGNGTAFADVGFDGQMAFGAILTGGAMLEPDMERFALDMWGAVEMDLTRLAEQTVAAPTTTGGVFPRFPTHIKPGPWNFDPGLIAPEWQDIFFRDRQQAFVYPLLRPTGRGSEALLTEACRGLTNLRRYDGSSGEPPFWDAGPRGPTYRKTGGATDEGQLYGADVARELDAVSWGQATIIFCGHWYDGTDARAVSFANGGTDTDHCLMLGETGTSTIRTRIRAGGTVHTVIGQTSIPTGTFGVFAATYENGRIRLWIVDKYDTNTSTSTIDYTGVSGVVEPGAAGWDLSLFNNGPLGSTNPWNQPIYWAAMLPYALTEAELLKISRDPMGWLVPDLSRLAAQTVGTGAAGPTPTTYTLSVGMTAAIQATLTRAMSFDAAIQQQGLLRTASLDAALQDTFTKGVSLDAAVLGVQQAIASLDAAIQQQGLTKLISLDAAIQQALTASASLDAAIQALGLTKAVSLDAAVLSTLTRTASLDAAIQQLGLTKTTSLDAVVQAVFTKAVSLDAALLAALTKTVSLDASIVSAGASFRYVSLDAAIQQLGITLSVQLNAAIQKLQSKTVSLDAAVQRRLSLTVSLDAYIEYAYRSYFQAAAHAAMTNITGVQG